MSAIGSKAVIGFVSTRPSAFGAKFWSGDQRPRLTLPARASVSASMPPEMSCASAELGTLKSKVRLGGISAGVFDAGMAVGDRVWSPSRLSSIF